jgi:hypothetical protein
MWAMGCARKGWQAAACSANDGTCARLRNCICKPPRLLTCEAKHRHAAAPQLSVGVEVLKVLRAREGRQRGGGDSRQDFMARKTWSKSSPRAVRAQARRRARAAAEAAPASLAARGPGLKRPTCTQLPTALHHPQVGVEHKGCAFIAAARPLHAALQLPARLRKRAASAASTDPQLLRSVTPSAGRGCAWRQPGSGSRRSWSWSWHSWRALWRSPPQALPRG